MRRDHVISGQRANRLKGTFVASTIGMTRKTKLSELGARDLVRVRFILRQRGCDLCFDPVKGLLFEIGLVERQPQQINRLVNIFLEHLRFD